VEDTGIVEEYYAGPLYTMDGRPVLRRYHCLNCGAAYQVGPEGDFSTIEALKGQGCPRCRGRGFRAGERTEAG
jgi:DNA-directed RNA polymerase subunit RPC12/RpoP